MQATRTYPGTRVSEALGALAGACLAVSGIASAQTATFHFESICRSDPAVNKNLVTVTLHDDLHLPLADVTINALWSFVDYRQNHAVFRYKLTSCTTDRDGVCNFSGGSDRARWQLSEVVGYDMGSPAFDTAPTTLCPNTTMIDFW
jgi:hypothetical protein